MEENRTLLIVDDEPETLKGYAEFLSVTGASAPARRSSRSAGSTGSAATAETYRLLLAKSGEEAIQLCEEELRHGRRVAAGFFDVKLGEGIDGLTTIRKIRELDKDIHCVVVTAYHDRTVDEINDLFGDDFKDQWDYLNKPFTRGEILQKARQMIAAWNRRRKLEVMTSQLIRSERLAAIGQVARGVGHEFGNILMRIMGKADLALTEKDHKKVKEHLEVVLKASERAGVIVRNLQSFSKPEQSFQSADLTVPIEEALSLVSHEFVKGSVKLTKDYQVAPPIRIDVGGLSQVFLNLMINAVHAMPKGGTISVGVRLGNHPEKDLPGVVARVSDTGTGIPDDVLPRIFEFAFTTKGDRGSGIGLSVAKDIVEGHGGEITVKSKIGQGTEFILWLPIK